MQSIDQLIQFRHPFLSGANALHRYLRDVLFEIIPTYFFYVPLSSAGLHLGENSALDDAIPILRATYIDIPISSILTYIMIIRI